MRPNSLSLAVLLTPGLALAEEPLSAIDWLNQPAPVSVAQPLLQPLVNPPVTEGVTVPDVTVMALDDVQPDAVGLLPSSTTGLPASLWQASATDTIVAQMSRLGDTPLPAIQALYYTLLLAEAEPPADAAENARFLRARLDALRKYGAVDAALALVERAGADTPLLFDAWLDLALLKGTEDDACRALADTPDLSDSYAKRIFCIARAGDWSTAALTYDTANAIGALDAHESALLAQFLDPEFAEANEMPPPRTMTPLLFRLYEASGMPLPTRNLPREYAVADLRGTMGWKAEVEAAERLARTGALPANRLLGLYTDRRPAASGGVWERVRAVQEFDAALESNDPKAIAEELPEVWRLMRANDLAVVFATLYGERLAALDLPAAADLAHEIALLSPVYESAARATGPRTRRLDFLAGVAKGAPDEAGAAAGTESAIARAFAATEVPPDHAGPLNEGRLGQAILAAAMQLQSTRPGQMRDLESSLATLRIVGLEDVARQAALQILLLSEAG
ncbi:hypothetical protein [Roseovarius indicus]|uniref:Uncharacterized protein n=1 Tax=Roseovarius indicus TaxID=540747 RepID=A0A0T5PBK4_9RHOB|nr:hypothetical protein [Roseovarius indicus]KRS18372.1 hypothetical protein XM52_09575 [Roseovarius indicus]OAO06943.1 hypothetical protein A8B76_13395 [Roseovarius indicus]QEW26776.1 hypothetical protein RIdsm_02581 [Roseovarius indicus]SFD60238.1 hypothetical protein SAMN04488031_101762 [Roseovarius indicus]